MGMLFNGRRQSQDREVRRHLLEDAGGHTLWMNTYSGRLFSGMDGNIQIDEAFLDKAQEGDWCFAETVSAVGKDSHIERIVLFKWNRVYPADVYFDIPLENWKLAEHSDFKGCSHKIITKEVYVK